MLTKCLYRKDKKPGLEIVRSYKKALLKDQRIIEVKDFGAGSRVFKSNSRKIYQIAKNAGISKKRAFLLNRLTSYLSINSALELGTSVGISSAAIAAGNPVKLVTVEGCPETGKIAKEYFERFGLDNISLEIGSFEELLSPPRISPPAPEGESPPTLEGESPPTPEGGVTEREISNIQHPPRPTGTPPKEGESPPAPEGGVKEVENSTTTQNQSPINQSQKFDLIYFDGNHQKEATLKYFNQLLPMAHNDSVFIFDDIHWSQGMEEAWEVIKAHPQVRVTIDSFFWGIVFFRKEQEKEHFILRL